MRAVTAIAFVFAFAAPPMAALAATSDPLAPVLDDPIAHRLDRCLADPKAISTLDIVTCYRTALGAYTSLVRIVYPKVLEHLDPQSRELVARSQTAWTAARRAVRDANGGPWRTDRGSIVAIEILQNDVRAMRDRIVALELYWPGYSGEGPLSSTPPR